eukprot:4733622-Alexandrium_andersonii.AAC.1
MSASLVGSEMCIRDRAEPANGSRCRAKAQCGGCSSRRNLRVRALLRRRVSPGRGPRVSRA